MDEPGILIGNDTVRFERLLPGPVERVWDYLTDSNKRGLWLASGEMEPRQGGSLNLFFHHATLSPEQAPIPDRYKHIEHGLRSEHIVTRWEPPHALAFTWGNGIGGAPSEVTFELTPKGKDVLLVLTHRRLGGDEAITGTAGGWHSHLAVLVERLNDWTPRAFWTLHNESTALYARKFESGV